MLAATQINQSEFWNLEKSQRVRESQRNLSDLRLPVSAASTTLMALAKPTLPLHPIRPHRSRLIKACSHGLQWQLL
jgi:hypothetical protein